jgi:putative membrane protein
MIRLLIRLVLNSVAVLITAYLSPGVVVDEFLTAMVVTVVLGLLNAVLKPILVLLTLPINLLTLGLFTLAINGLVILIASNLIPGFEVEGFIYAIIFSLILTLVNWVLSTLI